MKKLINITNVLNALNCPSDISINQQNIMQQDDSGPINISDVIDAIKQTDPEVQETFNMNPINCFMLHQPPSNHLESHHAQQPTTSSTLNQTNSINSTNAYVEIIEQPSSRPIKYRYKSEEERAPGSIPGEKSAPDNKTYPSIRIRNYKGWAMVEVSCVTKDQPYRPHPHCLVSKKGCKNGIYTMEINNDAMSFTFKNLGIQCTKKCDIDKALRLREEICVDPFRTGFSHRNQPTSIDLKAVRLCFQVFIGEKPQTRVPLTPVVSNPIFDQNGTSNLVIRKLSDCSADVRGGREIILLCDKVAKDDIKVRFYEVDCKNDVIWEAYGDFNQSNVYKQLAIAFKVPAYHNLNIDKPVIVNVQLKRPSVDALSKPVQFEYIPRPDRLQKLKRPMDHEFIRELQKSKQQKQEPMQGVSTMLELPKTSGGFLNDLSLKHNNIDTVPYQLTPYIVLKESLSPQPVSPATPLTPSYSNFGSPTYTPLQNQTLNLQMQQQNSNPSYCNYNFDELNQPGIKCNITTNHTTFNIHQHPTKPLGLINHTSPYQFENLNQHQNNLNETNLFSGADTSHPTITQQNISNNSMNIIDSPTNSQLLLSTLQTIPNFNSTELNDILMNDQARVEQEQQTMTDSFNRLTTETMEGIRDLRQYRIVTTRHP